MYNPASNEGPCSPMKKLKILGETQNVQHKSNEVVSTLKPIKETVKKSTEEADNTEEPLLQESSNQYVIFPIDHDDMWRMYKELVGNFWAVTETFENLESLKLDYNQKKYMKLFTSIFASPMSQGLVNENFAEEFCRVVQVTEAKFFFGHQLFVQNIHYEMYNKLLENYATNEEKVTLFKTVENYDSVVEKREWISQWKNKHFTEQLMASTCLHGLFFSAIELTSNWLKNMSRTNGDHELVEILDKITYEQELQRDFSCLMISHLKRKPSNQKILETINQAAKIEFNFLLNGLNLDLIGVGPQEVLEIIDKNTKAIKNKIFNSFIADKKQIAKEEPKETRSSSVKENQKLILDEDF